MSSQSHDDNNMTLGDGFTEPGQEAEIEKVVSGLRGSVEDLLAVIDSSGAFDVGEQPNGSSPQGGARSDPREVGGVAGAHSPGGDTPLGRTLRDDPRAKHERAIEKRLSEMTWVGTQEHYDSLEAHKASFVDKYRRGEVSEDDFGELALEARLELDLRRNGEEKQHWLSGELARYQALYEKLGTRHSRLVKEVDRHKKEARRGIAPEGHERVAGQGDPLFDILLQWAERHLGLIVTSSRDRSAGQKLWAITKPTTELMHQHQVVRGIHHSVPFTNYKTRPPHEIAAALVCAALKLKTRSFEPGRYGYLSRDNQSVRDWLDSVKANAEKVGHDDVYAAATRLDSALAKGAFSRADPIYDLTDDGDIQPNPGPAEGQDFELSDPAVTDDDLVPIPSDVRGMSDSMLRFAFDPAELARKQARETYPRIDGISPEGLASLLPTYGNWGGLGYGFQGEPLDPLDDAFRQHDLDYAAASVLPSSPDNDKLRSLLINAADRRLLGSMARAVKDDPSLGTSMMSYLARTYFTLKAAANAVAPRAVERLNNYLHPPTAPSAYAPSRPERLSDVPVVYVRSGRRYNLPGAYESRDGAIWRGGRKIARLAATSGPNFITQSELPAVLASMSQGATNASLLARAGDVESNPGPVAFGIDPVAEAREAVTLQDALKQKPPSIKTFMKESNFLSNMEITTSENSPDKALTVTGQCSKGGNLSETFMETPPELNLVMNAVGTFANGSWSWTQTYPDHSLHYRTQLITVAGEGLTSTSLAKELKLPAVEFAIMTKSMSTGVQIDDVTAAQMRDLSESPHIWGINDSTALVKLIATMALVAPSDHFMHSYVHAFWSRELPGLSLDPSLYALPVNYATDPPNGGAVAQPPSTAAIDPYGLYLPDSTAPSSLVFYSSELAIPASRQAYPTLYISLPNARDHLVSAVAMLAPFPVVNTGFYTGTGGGTTSMAYMKHICKFVVHGHKNLNVLITGTAELKNDSVNPYPVAGVTFGPVLTQSQGAGAVIQVNQSSQMLQTAYSLRDYLYSWLAPTSAGSGASVKRLSTSLTSFVLPRYKSNANLDYALSVVAGYYTGYYFNDPDGGITQGDGRDDTWNNGPHPSRTSVPLLAANGQMMASDFTSQVYYMPQVDVGALSMLYTGLAQRENDDEGKPMFPLDSMGLYFTFSARELYASHQLTMMYYGFSSDQWESMRLGAVGFGGDLWNKAFNYHSVAYTSNYAKLRTQLMYRCLGYEMPLDVSGRNAFDGLWIQKLRTGGGNQPYTIPHVTLSVGQLNSVLSVRLKELLLPAPAEIVAYTLKELVGRIHKYIGNYNGTRHVMFNFGDELAPREQSGWWKLMAAVQWSSKPYAGAICLGLRSQDKLPLISRRASTWLVNPTGMIGSHYGFTMLSTPKMDRPVISALGREVYTLAVDFAHINGLNPLLLGGVANTMAWRFSPMKGTVISATTIFTDETAFLSVVPDYDLGASTVGRPGLAKGAIADEDTVLSKHGAGAAAAAPASE
jgi:hypothetical protein